MNLRFPDKYLIFCVPGATIGGLLAAIMHAHPAAAVIAMISNFLLASPALLGLIQQLGKKRAFWSLLSLSLFAYFIESLGVYYGVPYGEFFYSKQLGPLWLTGVPVILPLSWVPLVIGSVTLARLLCKHRFSASLLAASLLVGVDLLLDPVAAKLQYWTWVDSGPIYGVPLSNFAGWFLSGFIGSLLIPPFTVTSLTIRFQLLLTYLLALLMWGAASVWYGFYGTAVIGYLLIGLTIWVMRKKD